VGFYASLVNINAYHQPGVEAGKKAAAQFLDLLASVKAALLHSGSAGMSAEAIATLVKGEPEAVYHCLNHLAANVPGIQVSRGNTPAQDLFSNSAA
jgi:glucose-6-phosphate isomerase